MLSVYYARAPAQVQAGPSNGLGPELPLPAALLCDGDDKGRERPQVSLWETEGLSGVRTGERGGLGDRA